jgi:hypothetical protein
MKILSSEGLLPTPCCPFSIFRREKARSRRVTTIGEEGDSKLSIEEFHQKLTWERWSGNGHLISPEAGRSPPLHLTLTHTLQEVASLLIPHNMKASGLFVLEISSRFPHRWLG